MSFLDAIHANLDDDGPRLVYADWLAERGDPRGELIQVQCALARKPSRVLEYRNNKLLLAHADEWERELRELAVANVGRLNRVVWRRGFPEELYLFGLSHLAAKVVAAAPTARGLFFYRNDAGRGAPLDDLLIRSWRAFGVNGELGDAGAARIAAALPDLRALDLVEGGFGEDGQRAIASLPLTDLTLQAHGPRVEIFGESLRRVALRQVEADLRSLAGRPLAMLLLETARLLPGSMEALASLDRLEELTINEGELADDDVARLPRVQRLDLEQNGLGPGAMRHLVGRTELVELRLSHNPIGDEGARILAGADLPNLREMWITDTGMTDAGHDALARAPGLRAEIHVRGYHKVLRRITT